MSTEIFGAIGKGIGGFFPDKREQHWYSEDVRDGGKTFANWLQTYQNSDNELLSDYASKLWRLTAKGQKMAGEDVKRIGGLLKSGDTYDPLASYERIREGNFSALGKQAANMAGYGEAADKLSMALRGLGNRGGGSYESILRQDRVNKNLTPVVNTIFNNLGTDSQGVENNRFRNILSQLQLMNERAEVPFRAAARGLAPIEARNQSLRDKLYSLGMLGDIAKLNTAGFSTKKHPWNNFLTEMGRATDGAIDLGMSLYSGGMIGGGGGSGGGGGIMSMFGGGGAGGGQQIDWGSLISALRSSGGGGGYSASQPRYYGDINFSGQGWS